MCFDEIMPVCAVVCMRVHRECSCMWQGCYGQMPRLGPAQLWEVHLHRPQCDRPPRRCCGLCECVRVHTRVLGSQEDACAVLSFLCTHSCSGALLHLLLPPTSTFSNSRESAHPPQRSPAPACGVGQWQGQAVPTEGHTVVGLVSSAAGAAPIASAHFSKIFLFFYFFK